MRNFIYIKKLIIHILDLGFFIVIFSKFTAHYRKNYTSLKHEILTKNYDERKDTKNFCGATYPTFGADGFNAYHPN